MVSAHDTESLQMNTNLYVQKVKPILFPTPVYWKLIPNVLQTLYTN